MSFDFTGVEDWARRKAASYTRKETLMEVGEWLEKNYHLLGGSSFVSGDNMGELIDSLQEGKLPGIEDPDTEYHESKEVAP